MSAIRSLPAAVAAMRSLHAEVAATIHPVSEDVLMFSMTEDGVLRFVIKDDAGIVYITTEGSDFLVNMSDDRRTGNKPYCVDFRYPDARTDCMRFVNLCAADLRTRRFIAKLQQR